MSKPPTARRDVARLFIGVAWLGAAASSVCFCINLFFLDDRASLWGKNQLDPAQRRVFVVTMIVSALLPMLVATAMAAKGSLERVGAQVWRWGHRLSPLALMAPIAPLIDRASFIESPITTLSYMLLIGLAAAVIGTRCLEEGFPNGSVASSEPSRFFVPSALVGAMCVSLFAHFAFYAVMRHHQMQSDGYDLGIFDNLMWHLTHGHGFASTTGLGPEGNHLGRHTTFGALLLVPFYAIWPRAETLIVIQAAFAASTPIPIYLLGRRVLGSARLGLVVALCYALYAPTHGAIFYDFHFLTMGAPLLAWVFFLLFTDHTRALIVMTALTLAWREDTGAVLAFGGLAVWAAGVHPRRTLKFVVICGVYFVLVKFVLMPLSHSHASFDIYYSKLKAPGAAGFWSILETFLTNPFFVFDEVFSEKRLLYVLHLFVPLLFFPLRDRTAWIALVPAAVFTLMGSRDPLYEIYFQYTTYWAPAAFLALVIVLNRRFVETARRRALVANTAAILLTTLLTSFFYGSIFESPTMRGGFRLVSYEWTENDAERLAAFRELASEIPPGASVALTTREVPHVSNRREAYNLEAGYFDAEFLLVRRTDIKEKRIRAANAYREALQTGKYERAGENHSFLLWKRTDRAGWAE